MGEAVGIKCSKEEGPQRVKQGMVFIGGAGDQVVMTKEASGRLRVCVPRLAARTKAALRR